MTLHYWKKPGRFENLILHFPTSKSERVSEVEGASKVSSLKQANK